NYIANPTAQRCNGCTGCKCIPRCLCVTYNGLEEIVCWDDEREAYYGEIVLLANEITEVTFSFVRDPDDHTCLLRLETNVGEVLDPDKAVECPDLSASWQIEVGGSGTGSGSGSGTEPGTGSGTAAEIRTVTIRNAKCETCGPQ